MRGRARKRRSTRRVSDRGVHLCNADRALRGDRRPGRMGRRSPVSSEAILAGVVGRAETADAAGTQRVRNALGGAAGELDATLQQASPAEGLADAARIRDESRSAHDRSRLHGGSHDDFSLLVTGCGSLACPDGRRACRATPIPLGPTGGSLRPNGLPMRARMIRPVQQIGELARQIPATRTQQPDWLTVPESCARPLPWRWTGGAWIGRLMLVLLQVRRSGAGTSCADAGNRRARAGRPGGWARVTSTR